MNESYLAGFFDGEGYVGVKSWKFGKSYMLSCHITNTDFDIIIEIQKKFGGIIHIEETQNNNWKDKITLCWNAQDCKDVLRKIFPFLIVKKRQVEMAFLFPFNKRGVKRTTELINEQRRIYEELRFLKMNRPIIPDRFKGGNKRKHEESVRKKDLAQRLYDEDNTLTCREIGEKIGVSAVMISNYISISRKSSYKKP